MAETNTPGEKKLSVAPSKTLTLKRGVEQGVVRQSFSHGRSKQVVVEKVKRRTVGPETKADAAPAGAAPAAKRPVITGKPSVAPAVTPATARPGARPSGVVLPTLTEEERNRRAHALDD